MISSKFTAAVSLGYLQELERGPYATRPQGLPAGLTIDDLDFCNPNSTLFHVDAVLLSAGQFKGHGRSTYRHPHRASKATIIGDSGGFSIIGNPNYWRGRTSMRDALDHLEAEADVAIALDVPSRCTTQLNHPFDTEPKCLEATRESFAYFQKCRKRADLKILTVIQGNTEASTRHWFDSVKDFEFEGFALGGFHKLNFSVQLPIFRKIIDENIIDRTHWVHVLGTSALESGLLLTAFARGLHRAVGREIPVTYDASTPFTQAYRHFTANTFARFDTRRVTIETAKPPRTSHYAGSTMPFPYRTSAIARRLTCGDLCVRGEPLRDHAWDSASHLLVANHNFDVHIQAIRQAHALYDLHPAEARQHFPNDLLEACGLIEEYFVTDKPDSLIKRHRDLLGRYAAKFQEDEERE